VEPEFPYDDDRTCDECGKYGAFNINGDWLCMGCIEEHQKELSNRMESGEKE